MQKTMKVENFHQNNISVLKVINDKVSGSGAYARKIGASLPDHMIGQHNAEKTASYTINIIGEIQGNGVSAKIQYFSDQS